MLYINRKTTMVLENEAGGPNLGVNRSNDLDDDNERDKLVQFETPDESSPNAQKYFSNVSANLRK